MPFHYAQAGSSRNPYGGVSEAGSSRNPYGGVSEADPSGTYSPIPTMSTTASEPAVASSTGTYRPIATASSTATGYTLTANITDPATGPTMPPFSDRKR